MKLFLFAALSLPDACGENTTGFIHSSQFSIVETARPVDYTSGYCILRGQVVPDINCY